MRFSFFAVLATAVSAASLNAMIENDFDFDLYEADNLDLAETWEAKDDGIMKAADAEARKTK